MTTDGTAGHCVSNPQRVVRGPPGCPGASVLRLTRLSPLYRLRLSLADSPLHADRIEFTAAGRTASLCDGLVVLVALLSTPDCSDAVTIGYRTIHHRTGAGFHRPNPLALSGARARLCRRPAAADT